MGQNNELGQRQKAQSDVNDETVNQIEALRRVAPRKEGAPEKHSNGNPDQAESTSQ